MQKSEIALKEEAEDALFIFKPMTDKQREAYLYGSWEIPQEEILEWNKRQQINKEKLK